MEAVESVTGNQLIDHLQQMILYFGESGVEKKSFRRFLVVEIAAQQGKSPLISFRKSPDFAEQIGGSQQPVRVPKRHMGRGLGQTGEI